MKVPTPTQGSQQATLPCLIFQLLVCLSIFLFPVSSQAEEVNAGFVQGLWYSSDTILEGVPVRIYAALRNNSPHDLTGTVRFTDNEKRIGSSAVSALSGRLVETWIDWTPIAGEHALSVSLEGAELHVIGGDTVQADIANITVEDTQVADYDTDKDGIGNETDTDDDNDEVSDMEEKTRGTNPLVGNPKPKVAEEEEKPKETVADTPVVPVPAETAGEEGLEKYIENETANALLGNVTEKVENAKQSLDAYRDERNQKLYTKATSTEGETALGTYTNNATITRSKIETKNTFLSSFISGVASLLQNIWTFVLWLLSKVLTHPALIQFLFLLSILYMLYRMMRRMARRQIN